MLLDNMEVKFILFQFHKPLKLSIFWQRKTIESYYFKTKHLIIQMTMENKFLNTHTQSSNKSSLQLLILKILLIY